MKLQVSVWTVSGPQLMTRFQTLGNWAETILVTVVQNVNRETRGHEKQSADHMPAEYFTNVPQGSMLTSLR